MRKCRELRKVEKSLEARSAIGQGTAGREKIGPEPRKVGQKSGAAQNQGKYIREAHLSVAGRKRGQRGGNLPPGRIAYGPQAEERKGGLPGDIPDPGAFQIRRQGAGALENSRLPGGGQDRSAQGDQ